MIAPAMHMANELLTIPVAVATLCLAAGIVAAAAAWAGRKLDTEKLPLMGVLGAFVFAAQMINFSLPGMPGTSGHLGGGVLLAIVLGPAGAIVTMAGILIVQCLIFQDGGLLALGCNIINLGAIPALAGWGLYRLLLGQAGQAKPWRQYLSVWAACIVGVTAGAAMVPLQAGLAGVLMIPVSHFLTVIVGVHVIIGFVEGLVTFAVIAYLRRARPEALGLASESPGGLSRRAVLASLAATALLLGGVVSWFASTHPDGLEWSYQEHRYGGGQSALKGPSPAVVSVDEWQDRWSLMSDYDKRRAALGRDPLAEPTADLAGPPGPAATVNGWRSLAGVSGTLATLALLWATSRVLRRRRDGLSHASPVH